MYEEREQRQTAEAYLNHIRQVFNCKLQQFTQKQLEEREPQISSAIEENAEQKVKVAKLTQSQEQTLQKLHDLQASYDILERDNLVVQQGNFSVHSACL